VDLLLKEFEQKKETLGVSEFLHFFELRNMKGLLWKKKTGPNSPEF
jgi:hypothetical protein